MAEAVPVESPVAEVAAEDDRPPNKGMWNSSPVEAEVEVEVDETLWAAFAFVGVAAVVGLVVAAPVVAEVALVSVDPRPPPNKPPNGSCRRSSECRSTRSSRANVVGESYARSRSTHRAYSRVDLAMTRSQRVGRVGQRTRRATASGRKRGPCFLFLLSLSSLACHPNSRANVSG